MQTGIVRYVGSDPGSSGNNTICAWLDRGTLVRQELAFPSFVTIGVPEQYGDLDGGNIESAHPVKLKNGKIYTVGQKDEQGLVVGADRCTNGNRTALLLRALQEIGVNENDKLVIAAGIPTALAYKKDEFGRNQADTDFIEKVRQSFFDLPNDILSIKVYPEVAPASYIFYAKYDPLEKWGTLQKDRLNEGEKTLFADIGGDTLDIQMIVVMRENGILKPKTIFSTCISYPGHGVRGMHSLLNKSVCTAFSELGQKAGGGTLNQYQLESALNRDEVTINGVVVQTKRLALEATERQAAKIQSTLTTAVNHLEADNVVFSGGGPVGIFKPYIENWFDSHLLLDEWACSKGLLTLAAKDGLMMAQQKRPTKGMTFTQSLKVLQQW